MLLSPLSFLLLLILEWETDPLLRGDQLLKNLHQYLSMGRKGVLAWLVSSLGHSRLCFKVGLLS